MKILYSVLYIFLLLIISNLSHASPQEEERIKKGMVRLPYPKEPIRPLKSPPAATRPSVSFLLPTDMQSSNKKKPLTGRKILYPQRIPYAELLTIFNAPMKPTKDRRGDIASKVQINVEIEGEKACVACSHKMLGIFLNNFIVVDSSSRVIGGHLKTPVVAILNQVVDPRRVKETLGEGYVSSMVKYDLYNQATKELIPDSLFTMVFNFRES